MNRLTTIPTADQLKNVRRAARDLGCVVYTDTYYHIKGGYLMDLFDRICDTDMLPKTSFELYETKLSNGQPYGPALRIRRK